MDVVQWFTVGICVVHLLGGLLEVQDGERKAWNFLANIGIMSPLVGRVFGWW